MKAALLTWGGGVTPSRQFCQHTKHGTRAYTEPCPSFFLQPESKPAAVAGGVEAALLARGGDPHADCIIKQRRAAAHTLIVLKLLDRNLVLFLCNRTAEVAVAVDMQAAMLAWGGSWSPQ